MSDFSPEDLDREITAMLAHGRDGSHSDSFAVLETAAALSGMVAASVAPSQNKNAIRSEVLLVKPAAHARRRLWWVAIAAAASLAFSGVAVASRQALPGDALYPIKRAFSAVNVAVSIPKASHAEALLDRAEGVLADASALARHHELSREQQALLVFENDLADARSAVAHLSGVEQVQFENRADDLERRAGDLRAQEVILPQDRSTVTPNEEQGGQSEGPANQTTSGDQSHSDGDHEQSSSGSSSHGKSKGGGSDSGRSDSSHDKSSDGGSGKSGDGGESSDGGGSSGSSDGGGSGE